MLPFAQRFEPTTASVPRARLLARSLHTDLPQGVMANLELVVTELAANVVRHAHTPFAVSITPGPVVRVDVTDGSQEVPVLQHPEHDEPGGRGLQIVDACASQWGYQLLPEGKVVWAALDPSD